MEETTVSIQESGVRSQESEFIQIVANLVISNFEKIDDYFLRREVELPRDIRWLKGMSQSKPLTANVLIYLVIIFGYKHQFCSPSYIMYESTLLNPLKSNFGFYSHCNVGRS